MEVKIKQGEEMIDGFDFCVVFKCIHHCTGGGRYIAYQLKNNGWTEITPDNEHELADKPMTRTIIGHIGCDGRMYTTTINDCHLGIGTMAEYGGYYYYVLPELKMEETK